MKPYLIKKIRAAVREVVEENGANFSDLTGDEFFNEFVDDITVAVTEVLLDEEE